MFFLDPAIWAVAFLGDDLVRPLAGVHANPVWAGFPIRPPSHPQRGCCFTAWEDGMATLAAPPDALPITLFTSLFAEGRQGMAKVAPPPQPSGRRATYQAR
jgi:hypothetical protein